MRIGLVGAGAIGGFLAAHLTRAGGKVHALARGETLAAWREGLTLADDAGETTVKVAEVSGAADGIGPCDLVLFTVKGQDSEAAADAMAPMVGPHTRILSFQNGLFGVECLADRFGAARVLAGVTYVPARVERPGRVVHTGPVRRFVFGPYDGGSPGAVAQAFAGLAASAGLEVRLLDDPMPEVWAKFVMLAPFHVIAALTRLPLGAWIPVAETRDLYRRGMEEVAAVASARGVELPDGLVARNLAFARETADPRTRASMLDDLERGRPLELEATIGWLLREGERLGLALPIHAAGHALLKPFATGAPAPT